MRGANLCSCADPDWRVKGQPLDLSANAKRMQSQQLWHDAWLRAAFDLLPPGGLILAFSGTRTFHRLAAAMDEVGFEVVGLRAWAYGSGFPKSLNISKALDRAAGVEPSRITENPTGSLGGFGDAGWNATPRWLHYDEPGTDDAKKWEGWGTALKPAWEPVLVGRRP